MIGPGEMWDVFSETYLPEDAGLRLIGSEVTTGRGHTTVTAQLLVDGQHRTIVGEGNGPIDALVDRPARPSWAWSSRSRTTPSMP